MMVSQSLIQEITRSSNCFNLKNLTSRFTKDPFSATNTLRSSDAGFTAKHAVGLALPTTRKTEPGSVILLRSSLHRRKVKKVATQISQKTLPAARATGFKSNALTYRGARLQRMYARAARLDKQSK